MPFIGAAANTSIRTASHIAILLSSNASTRSQVGDPVSRRNDPRGRIDQNHAERLVLKLVEVALPTRSAKTPGFIDAERFCRKGSECEVNRFALGRQAVTVHDRRACFIIDIDISA